MANEEQLAILLQGVNAWNKWRRENPDATIDLKKVNLEGLDLRDANLSKANFLDSTLKNVNLEKSDLRESWLPAIDFGAANLNKANLTGANLNSVKLVGANLSGATFLGAHLWQANLSKADLRNATLSRAYLLDADLSEANLRGANLMHSELGRVNLYKADLSNAMLVGADLGGADLREADLRNTNLSGASFVQTKIDKTNISGSRIYSINVWDLKGEFADQKDLVITRAEEPVITVDNVKIAQFIYLILDNNEVRNMINTLTSRTVLILGRFSLPARKTILDALRSKLREYDLLPIVFDFERPTDKDFTETIRTLAGLSFFVIADVTNPKSSPLELQATVPDYQIPFIPIIQEGESPFTMMVDLQKKYNWVLDTLEYDSIDTLIAALKPAIIDPAIEKHNELRLIKAREPKIRSAKDFLEN